MTPTPSGSTSARRECPVCGTGFVARTRQATHTYCSTRCRRTAYEQRHRRRGGTRADRDAVADVVVVADDDDTPDAVADAAPGREQGAPQRRRPPTTRTTDAADGVGDAVRDSPLCPHCRQPIALVTLVLTPTAAHVTAPTPPLPHDA